MQGNGNKSFEDFQSRKNAALSVMSKFQKGRKEIENADADVIFEAEAVAKNEGRCDDDVPEEDWDTRVFEGRALMNRRRLQGWTM